MKFNSIEEILEDMRIGKPVVILDDEERENEGDVIFAAEHATTENVNFMAKYARGLICMPMDASYSDRYNLPQMCIVNTDNHTTAFSVSIDHVDTTTGISAVERGLEHISVHDSQVLLNIMLHFRSGCCGKGNNGPDANLIYKMPYSPVFRSKVMSPLRNAMSLINGIERDFRTLKEL